MRVEPRGEGLAMYRETQTEHFEPLLVKSRPIIVGCCAATLALIVIAWVMIGVNVVRVALTGLILITAISAFTVGSSHRLRDLRTRRGRLLRQQPENATELARLPPLETIRRRLRIARTATAAGALGLLVTTAIGFLGDYPSGVGPWSLVVTILALVASALYFVAATYTRPLD